MAHSNAAKQVIQKAVLELGKWVGIDLTSKFTISTDRAANEAIEMLWKGDRTIKELQLLFDSVRLSEHPSTYPQHSWEPKSIADESPTIPYPRKTSKAPADFNKLKLEIKQVLNSLDSKDWENLSLLTLILEKYGSFISFGESDVALVDIARSTAAVAAALVNNSTGNFNLVAGDLSGIQKFIYTISSDGALKSLRARSFYLELVTEEVVQQLLTKLDLPRTNVIYAGGGNLYILASGVEDTKNIVKEVREQFNKWLEKAFQGKVFLALDCLSFAIADVTTTKFADYWSEITAKKLAQQKSRKFSEQIYDFIKPRTSHEPCRVCHRDDVEKLEQLNPNEPDSVLACGTCRRMFRLGGQLLRVEAIVRSTKRNFIPNAREEKLILKLPNQTVYYHLFKRREDLVKIEGSETVFLVNNWHVKQYRSSNVFPLLLGNYAQKSGEEPDSTMRANEMAEKKAKGISRVGYLRMDVDRLGRIFAEGLGDKKTLPRIAGLSRQMSYFFKVYLNSLAEARRINIPDKIKQLAAEDERLDLVFIYAGGDDLFVGGAWDQIVEFAFDVYQCFRAYTGYNSDITLSGGIGIADTKFPLYQAANESGKAEEAAKGNGKDSLGLFGEVFKWDEWLGINGISTNQSSEIKYQHSAPEPPLIGILPFVSRLNQQLELNASRAFVRNLLATAQKQEQMIKERKRKIDEIKREQPDNEENRKAIANIKYEQWSIRYYLHLPKVAYTLARLPVDVREHPDFGIVRTSLKSPYNAPYFRAIATWIELLNRK